MRSGPPRIKNASTGIPTTEDANATEGAAGKAPTHCIPKTKVVITPDLPPSGIEPSSGAVASLKVNALSGKPPRRLALTPEEASRVAQQDYAATKTDAYTADVNYTGGPDLAATAEYLTLLDRPWRNRRVLDVGCGEGKLPNEHAPLRRARVVIGVDLSMPFLQQAARESKSNTGYVRGDMSRLPVMSDSMDSVISRFALHYATDLPALFKEIARVLKPGGDLTFVCNMIHGKGGAPVPSAVTEAGWIPIRLSDRVIVRNLAHTDQGYFDAMAAAGLEVELERRFPGNHKIGLDYTHRDEIELEAVIIRARKPARE